jgi:hypothetical protein
MGKGGGIAPHTFNRDVITQNIFTLKMMASRSSEALVSNRITARRYNPDVHPEDGGSMIL